MNLTAQLGAAAADIDRLLKQLEDARERRNRLIFAATDDGISTRKIAAAADISQPAVIHILNTPQPWFGELAR